MSEYNKYYLSLVIMVPAVQYSQTRLVVLVYKITEVNVAYLCKTIRVIVKTNLVTDCFLHVFCIFISIFT